MEANEIGEEIFIKSFLYLLFKYSMEFLQSSYW